MKIFLSLLLSGLCLSNQTFSTEAHFRPDIVSKVGIVNNVPPHVVASLFEIIRTHGGISPNRPQFFPFPITPNWTKHQNVYSVVFYYSTDGCSIVKLTASILANGNVLTFSFGEILACIRIDI